MLRICVGLAAAILLLFCATGRAAPEDDYRAGRRAYQAGDVMGALQLLRKPADAGHAPSQSLLAFVLDSAALYDEAAAYYRKAVEQGDADGEFGLATAHLTGHGVPKDPVIARELFERAARRHHTLAIRWLAENALKGEPVVTAGPRPAANPAAPRPAAPDPAAPRPIAADDLDWIRKAAAGDHLPSVDFLALAYRNGRLGEPDLALAKEYEARAEKLRFPNGRPRQRRNN